MVETPSPIKLERLIKKELWSVSYEGNKKVFSAFTGTPAYNCDNYVISPMYHNITMNLNVIRH